MLSISEILFGIELETCFCADSGTIRDNHMAPNPYRNAAYQLYTSRLIEIAKEKGVDVVIRYQNDPKKDIDYTSWSVTKDDSIRCSFRGDFGDEQFYKLPTHPRADKYFKQGISHAKRCAYYTTSVEIVTPIYKYDIDGDYATFISVLEKVIFAPEFTYTSNISQGMHVNISHPKQNFLKTLEMWWYFEDVIMLATPVGHRGTYYVRLLRNIFPNIESLREGYDTFYANPEVPPAKYTSLCKKSNRFEFRMVPAAMSFEHIAAWVGFCARFVATSVVFEKPDDKDSGNFDELFSYIDSEDIKQYFNKTIEENVDQDYNMMVPIAKKIREGMRLTVLSLDSLKKICMYNLIPLNIMLMKALEEGNSEFLKDLVLLTGEEKDTPLDLKDIIDRWDSYYRQYMEMLNSVINDKDSMAKSTAYTIVILTLSGKQLPDWIDDYIPDHYSPVIRYLKSR